MGRKGRVGWLVEEQIGGKLAKGAGSEIEEVEYSNDSGGYPQTYRSANYRLLALLPLVNFLGPEPESQQDKARAYNEEVIVGYSLQELVKEG